MVLCQEPTYGYYDKSLTLLITGTKVLTKTLPQTYLQKDINIAADFSSQIQTFYFLDVKIGSFRIFPFSRLFSNTFLLLSGRF